MVECIKLGCTVREESRIMLFLIKYMIVESFTQPGKTEVGKTFQRWEIYIYTFG